MVNENASLIKYEPPKCDECGRKIVVLSDLCAKCAAGIELNGKEQAGPVSEVGYQPSGTKQPTNPPPKYPSGRQAEPVAHMFPSDLERFETEETFAQAYSVAVGSPDEKTVPLYKEAPAVAVNEPFYSGFISGEQDWKVLQTAVDTWGEYEQVMMAIGECGEFLTLMGRKVQGRLIESDMHDEIADVLIMMHQMANIYGIDHVRARVRHKMEKLAAKLAKATAQAEAAKGGV